MFHTDVQSRSTRSVRQYIDPRVICGAKPMQPFTLVRRTRLHLSHFIDVGTVLSLVSR